MLYSVRAAVNSCRCCDFFPCWKAFWQVCVLHLALCSIKESYFSSKMNRELCCHERIPSGHRWADSMLLSFDDWALISNLILYIGGPRAMLRLCQSPINSEIELLQRVRSTLLPIQLQRTMRNLILFFGQNSKIWNITLKLGPTVWLHKKKNCQTHKLS